MADLFGGGSSIDYKMPEYLKQPVVDLGAGVTKALKTPFEAYGGERVADPSGTQMDVMSMLKELLGKGNAGQIRLIDNIPGANGGAAGTIQDYMDPYLEGVLAPTLRGIDEDTAQNQMALDARQHMGGAFGDTGSAVLESENTNRGNTLKTDARNKAYSDAFASAMGLRQGDLERMMAGDSQSLQMLQSLFGMGDVERETDQAQKDADYQEFLRRIGFDWDTLSKGANVTAAIPFPSSNATQQGSTAGGIAGLLGGAGSLFSSLPDLFDLF